MDQITINIINKSNNPLPRHTTKGSAGMDVCAYLEDKITLQPMERRMIPTGLFMAIPNGYEVQVRPRSGLAIKHGITLVNAPGTIDADYRGELGVLVINLSQEPYTIHSGDRIAQLVVARYEQAQLMEVELLDDTERGAGGFGHTGK